MIQLPWEMKEKEEMTVAVWYKTDTKQPNNPNCKQPLLLETGAVHTWSTRLIIKHVRLI